MTTPDPNPCPCLLCPKGCTGHVGDDRPVCQRHRDRLRRDLNGIPDAYALLADELTAQGTAGPKVSGSREAPIPGRLDVLSLRGPGSFANIANVEDQHGATPVFAALESWERDWRHTRGLAITGVWPTLTAALTGIVRFLDAHLDWACDNHPAVEEFAADVRSVIASMRAARGDRPDSVYVGRCPEPDCGAALRASTWHDTIRCSQCSTEWARDRWVWLGRVMRESAV